MSLTVETSQSEVQELRVAADYQREVQSILVKAFGQVGSASAAESEFAERQLVTVVVRIQQLFSCDLLAVYAHLCLDKCIESTDVHVGNPEREKKHRGMYPTEPPQCDCGLSSSRIRVDESSV